jgi:hypothetical protein
MGEQKSNPVLDISPWPTGQGFKGRDAWWETIGNLEEQQKLDQLIGAALLSQEVCERLLGHDEGLLLTFDLSEPTRRWLLDIQAGSLTEFAQAIVSRTELSA